ncbi:Ig-like domain-containing protein [Vibrio navarrensis]|uniref:RapA2 cadherin-like domain-containing protein n=1 Tax=Vibrio navarrensis TaxID=29495 RepID=A0AAJ4IDI2_9VIBR|nr:hypothetical protein I3X05_07220 [Vibrio navarrensis]
MKVTVNAVNDAVDAVNDEVTVAEDGSITLNLTGNDSAPDGGLEITHINGVALTAMPKTSRWTMAPWSSRRMAR